MREYLSVLRHILENGRQREDRTGVGTIGVFGDQMRINLRNGFPLLTTKRLPFRWIAVELLWFLSGGTSERTLREQGVDIWKEWATEEQCARFGREGGDLGPIYGWQWRRFGGDYALQGIEEAKLLAPGRFGFDQIAWIEGEIARNPFSRRLVVSAWNPADAQRVTLPPCHTLFQFYVDDRVVPGVRVPNRTISCHLYARSIDAFLGLPFNIASYALLTHLMAHVTGMCVGELVISFGDLHLYKNHLNQAREQIEREPRPLPQLRIDIPPRTVRMDGFRVVDLIIDEYDPYPVIRAEVAV